MVEGITPAPSGRKWLPCSSAVFPYFEISLRMLLASLMVSIVAVQVLAALTLMLWIVLLIGGMKYTRTLVDIPLMCFIAIRVLSIIFSEHPGLSLQALPGEVVFYPAYFFFAFYLQHADENRFAVTMRWVIIATLAVIPVSIGRVLLDITERANSLSGGGTLATHVSLLIVVVLATAKNRSMFPRPWQPWAVIVVLAVGLAFSVTRGDTIATILAMAVYGIIVNRRLIVGMVVFSVIALVLIPNAWQRFSTLSNPLAHTTDRLALWSNAAEKVWNHPVLGYGPRTFHVVFDDMANIADKRVGAWHNDLVQLYMESGVAGVLGYLGVIVSVALSVILLIRGRSPRDPARDIGWAGILMLLTSIVIGFFGTPTISITNGLLLRWLTAIVAVAALRRQIRHQDV